MPLVVTIPVVVFSILYFRKLEVRMLAEGTMLGALGFAIRLALDLLMFMWGSMKMTFANYVMDVGLTYLIIPTVTIGTGFLIEKRR